MFSVIIPLYNKNRSILDTVAAVLNQTYTDFEIVIVDDGSTDDSLRIVKSIKDSRIRIFSQKNQGVSVARNLGIKNSKYQWIAFLDADDIWKPTHLSEIYSLIRKHPEKKIFATSFVFSNALKKNKAGSENFEIKIYDEENYFKEMISGHILWTSITVVHRNVFKEVGMFPVGIIQGEDRDLWDRIIKKFDIVKSRVVTAIYKIDAENRASSKYTELEKTYISRISLSRKTGEEKKYFKKLIIGKLKDCLKKGQIKDLIKILWKFNFQLVF